MTDYDLRPCTMRDVTALCVAHHGYKSAGRVGVYAFAVHEGERVVAAYAWQPPPPGAARAVSPGEPSGALALSRMVAVPREERILNHVSRPLRRQMNRLIDRTRYPVLVTYSDESLGHTGHVYKCSGWTPTTRRRVPIFVTPGGARASRYSDGLTGGRELIRSGHAWIQRWEHRVCPTGSESEWMLDHGWFSATIDRRWQSGSIARKWFNRYRDDGAEALARHEEQARGR